MPVETFYSKRSLAKIKTCDIEIQEVFMEVGRRINCTVIDALRGKERQDKYFDEGLSKVRWPHGKHNVNDGERRAGILSQAIDVAPYITGKGVVYEPRQCYFFAGQVKVIAESLGIKLRLGADWDGDGDVNDQTFRDIIHFEKLKRRKA